MPKICILSRVSSAPQQIEPQTNELINACSKLGYSRDDMIIIESIESAIKLSEEQRLGIIKLKQAIENQDVNAVICWEPSRLARQQKTLFSIRDYLVEKKIQLYILHPETKLLDDDGNINATANIVFSLFSTLAENEMMIKAERFKRAKAELRSQNKKFAGSCIFGYMKDEDKRCVEHPLHGMIVKEIFNHYANEDSSLYETYLWASTKWPDVFKYEHYTKAQHKIRHIFETSIYYTGNWCYKPLISNKLWDIVHEKLDKARCRARYKNTRPLLCRGKIYCGVCGNRMTPSGGTTKAYICVTNKLHRAQINFDIADWIMWEETRTIININSAVDSRKKIREMEDNIKYKEVYIKQLDDKLKENEDQMNKLLNVYMKGIIQIEQFESKMDELKSDKMKLNTEKNEQNVILGELRVALNDNRNDLMKPAYINADLIEDFETRLEFVRKYISKMIVTKEEDKKYNIRFEYTRPLISTRSMYRFVFKNQKRKDVYRINEDGTTDWIL